MKKILNITLLLIIVLIMVLTISTKEAKATGNVIWNGASSLTIRETLKYVANPIVGSRQYCFYESRACAATATVTYSGNETITNSQITKTAVLNLSNLTFNDPGDYKYELSGGSLIDSRGEDISNYFLPVEADYVYEIIVSVRNAVDANNNPTGDFNASLVLQKCEYNEQTQFYDVCSKISPSSGVLYIDYDYVPNRNKFGHIEISKTVKGIGASVNEYFPVTITINNDPNDPFDIAVLDARTYTYPMAGIDATVTYNGNTINNPTTITNGTPTTIYIKHGQTATVGQVTMLGGGAGDAIPYGISNEKAYDSNKSPVIKRLANADGIDFYGSYFTVQENPGDYSPAYSINADDFTSGYSISARYVEGGHGNTIDFENTKEMSPVTGLIFTILPYLILAGIGVGGALLIIHLKKEEKKAKAN